MAKHYDPIFKERFGIRTPIVYTWDLTADPKYRASFQRAWRRFYKETEPTGSKRRRERFDAFFDKLYSLGDDLLWCEKVTIRYISRKVGYGVFATEDIRPNAILNHYAGILRSDTDIDLSNDSTFAFDDFKKYSIDAMKQGNWARFMNHASEEEANAVAWEHYAPFGPRIVFIAGKEGIKEGDQLLYSYGADYWEAREPATLK